MDLTVDELPTLGDIISCTFESYWKFEFTLLVTTSKGYIIRIYTGGCSDDIYRYDPSLLDWDEHMAAVIQNFEIVTKNN